MPRRTPAPKPNRPRDPNAPPKPRRPRDELGRPLSWSDRDRLVLEDYDALPLEENHRLGIDHWNSGRFFPAHEAWETAWKQAREDRAGETEFFKGLSQLGAGYTHLLRGNLHGAATLLRRGAGRILQYEDGHRGVDVRRVAAAVLTHALYIERAEEAGRPAPELDPPRV
jgi:uncharacterized protein